MLQVGMELTAFVPLQGSYLAVILVISKLEFLDQIGDREGESYSSRVIKTQGNGSRGSKL